MEYHPVVQKKEILPSVHGTGRPTGHYAKLDESEREGQILHGSIYVQNLKQNSEMESRMVTTGSWEVEETGRCWSKGTSFWL